MLTLTDRLRERIQLEGPITFHDWMNAALYDPEQGYYCRSDHDVWGRKGDYRTSPERSILFAATFARYFARLHDTLCAPRELTIVEVGAGEGHFAETVLQTLQQRFPEIFLATRYFLDEAGAGARSRAKQRLARFADRIQFRTLEDLDQLHPAIIFANELLDAFPVHRVIVQGGKLNEFYVGVNDEGRFQWLIGATSTHRLEEHLAGLENPLVEGQIAEVNLGIEDWLKLVTHKLRTGYLITVDYGAESRELYGARVRSEGTLRAFHRHEFAVDLLTRPGDQDITSSVDWTLVRRLSARRGFEVVAFEPQDKFLLDAGLLEEVELRVDETRVESEKLRLRTNAREMILPGGMAESFQVLVQKKNE